VIITLLTVAGTTLSSALVAYGFARIPFRGSGVLFGLMLATIMIPFPVTMVSLFRIFRWLDVNSPINSLARSNRSGSRRGSVTRSASFSSASSSAPCRGS
jgi:multiple sugar transport system permease protein